MVLRETLKKKKEKKITTVLGFDSPLRNGDVLRPLPQLAHANQGADLSPYITVWEIYFIGGIIFPFDVAQQLGLDRIAYFAELLIICTTSTYD